MTDREDKPKLWGTEVVEAESVTKKDLFDYLTHLGKPLKDGPDLFMKNCPDCKTTYMDIWFSHAGCPLCKTRIYAKAE